MAKNIVYPIFYQYHLNGGYRFIAVFNPTEALEVTGANYTNGFTYSRYYSRAKVIKLERQTGEYLSAEEFFKRVEKFMQGHLNKVRVATIKALPEFGQKLLNS
jgi:hypothetical protein